MNATLAAVLGLTLAQAPSPDYVAVNKRQFSLPIEYLRDRKLLRQVQLYVSADRGATWTREAEVWPDQDKFVYVAPKDGLYWFQIVNVDLKGNLDPANMTKEPPAMKALVDTVAPLVRFTSARRYSDKNGDRASVEWVIDDQYPDDSKTKVFFRPTGSEGYWMEVTGGSRGGVDFPLGTAGPVVVKVAVQDLAGNKNEGLKEIPAGANTHTTASLSPGSAAGPAHPGVGALPPPIDLTPAGPGPLAPPGGPVAPPNPGPTPPTTPVVPTAPPAQPVIPQNPVAAAPPAVQPGPVVQPPAPPPQPQPQPTGPSPAAVFQGTPSPAAAWSGSATPQPAADPRGPVTPVQNTSPGGNPNAVFSGQPGPAPSVEVSRVQVINQLRFDIGYQVEQQGPSGVSRVDLWVTRDDGQSWVKWSQHDGRETPIRVALDARPNPQREGLYGFRLVPVSGAGLSEREPTRGDAPDLRVIVDLSPPRIEWYDPVADPHDPGVLVFQWRATDQNFGDNPITLEWAENRAGPWTPVAGAADAVVPATRTDAVRRLPNTGRYAWRVPSGLPPRVYIKITARDAAGNVQEGVIEPILIDLAKPRARINGIVTAPALSRP